MLDHRIEALPNFALSSDDGPSAALRTAGLGDFHAAARWVRALPYARNSVRDFRAVVDERCGTCSSKHALLAHVARAHRRPVALVLGSYEMSERNTPGVGPVLEAHGLASILEVHCFLRHRDVQVDLTRAGAAPCEPIRFLHEEEIEPDQVEAYKPSRHRALLAGWLAQSGAPRRLSLDAAWRIREACLAALEGA